MRRMHNVVRFFGEASGPDRSKRWLGGNVAMKKSTVGRHLPYCHHQNCLGFTELA